MCRTILIDQLVSNVSLNLIMWTKLTDVNVPFPIIVPIFWLLLTDVKCKRQNIWELDILPVSLVCIKSNCRVFPVIISWPKLKNRQLQSPSKSFLTSSLQRYLGRRSGFRLLVFFTARSPAYSPLCFSQRCMTDSVFLIILGSEGE